MALNSAARVHVQADETYKSKYGILMEKFVAFEQIFPMSYEIIMVSFTLDTIVLLIRKRLYVHLQIT